MKVSLPHSISTPSYPPQAVHLATHTQPPTPGCSANRPLSHPIPAVQPDAKSQPPTFTLQLSTPSHPHPAVHIQLFIANLIPIWLRAGSHEGPDRGLVWKGILRYQSEIPIGASCGMKIENARSEVSIGSSHDWDLAIWIEKLLIEVGSNVQIR